MTILTSQLACHIKVCNSQSLSIHDNWSNFSITKINTEIGKIQDNLNFLNIAVEDHFASVTPERPTPLARSSTYRGKRLPPPQALPSKRSIYHGVSHDWSSSFSPLSTAYITDPSGLSDRVTIGSLIKGMFSWSFPHFQVEELPPAPGVNSKIYKVPGPLNVHLTNSVLHGLRVLEQT